MTGLGALPAEILLLIIESVREKGICPEIIPEPDQARADQALKTLYNICLVSRCFREFGQRVLYQEFSLSYDIFIKMTINKEETWWPGRLASFINTLVARPDLAALVKRAFIHIRLLVPEELEASMEQAERALGIPQCRRQDPWTRLLYLIFGLMPNLEHMVLQPYCSGHRKLPANPLEWMAPSLPVWEFPRLRSLELSHDSEISYIPLQFPYKQWPISTLTLRNPPGRFRKYLAALGEIPTIVNLRILDSHLDTKAMRALVGAATITELHSFTYVIKESNYDGDVASACDTILALRRCEKTLRHLHIDTRQVHHSQGAHERVMFQKQRISSLKQFTELETLVISAESLCDHSGPAPDRRTLYAELLPPSLKSLRVTGGMRV